MTSPNSRLNVPTNGTIPIISNVLTLDKEARIGIGIHGAVGGISALVTMLLMVHLFIVAAVRRHERGKLNGEKIFIATHLGWYFTCLMLCDWIMSFGHFIQSFWAGNGLISEGPLCTAQAIMIQMGGFGTSVFSAVIAVHTFNSLVLNKVLPRWAAITVIVVSWASIVVIDLIGMALSQKTALGPFYGIAGHWCWIGPNYPLQRAFMHYVPMLLSALISIVCYGLVFFKLRGNLRISGRRFTFQHRWNGAVTSLNDYQSFLTALANRMLWYPISYVFLILPMTIVQFLFITGMDVAFSVWVFSGILLASMGVVNVIIYCTTRSVLGPKTLPPSTQELQVTVSQNTLIGEPYSGRKSGFHFDNTAPMEKYPTNNATRTPTSISYGFSPDTPTTLRSFRNPFDSNNSIIPYPGAAALPQDSASYRFRTGSESTTGHPPFLGHHTTRSFSSNVSISTAGHYGATQSPSTIMSGNFFTADPAPQTQRALMIDTAAQSGRSTPIGRAITPTSVLMMEMENSSRSNSPMPFNHRRNLSDMLLNQSPAQSNRGLAPPPRQPRANSPTNRSITNVERAIKGTVPPPLTIPSPVATSSTNNALNPASKESPNGTLWGGKGRAALSAVVSNSDDMPAIPPTPTVVSGSWTGSEGISSSPSTPRALGHRKLRSKPSNL